MTTLAALATKDCVVLGCDSLATITKNMIDPVELIRYFDPKKDWELKADKDGNPLLKSFNDLSALSKSIPVEHITHMTKLFSLHPLHAGAMTTGIASIGNRTIKSLIDEFAADECPAIQRHNYTFEDVSKKLVDYIAKYYDKEYTKDANKPSLELIIAGYPKGGSTPEIYRVRFPHKEVIKGFQNATFGILFGGQMKEIQRIVFGTDAWNELRIEQRSIELLRKYRELILSKINKNRKKKLNIPEPTSDEFHKELKFFRGWDLVGFDANWPEFSEQNAIECVDFFVEIMVKSQQFGSEMPTVGGDVHIALITSKDGFKFVSREEYLHKTHSVLKHKEL